MPRKTVPSINVVSKGTNHKYMLLRRQAVIKIPDNCIGYYIKFSKKTRTLKIRTILHSDPYIVVDLATRGKESRFIGASRVVDAMRQHGILEMGGEWNEDTKEFTFHEVESTL